MNISWKSYKYDRYVKLQEKIKYKAGDRDAFWVKISPLDKDLHKKLKEGAENFYVSDITDLPTNDALAFVVAKDREAFEELNGLGLTMRGLIEAGMVVE